LHFNLIVIIFFIGIMLFIYLKNHNNNIFKCNIFPCLILIIIFRNLILYGAFFSTLVTLLLFLYLCWLEACPFPGKRGNSATPTPGNEMDSGGDRDDCINGVVSNSRWLRLAVFIVSVLLLASCAVITLVTIMLLLNRQYTVK
jgi:hypothetical protein